MGIKGVMHRSEHPQRRVTWHHQSMRATIRAQVEPPFRGLKCQFNFRKVRYKGLAKNTAQ